MSRTVRFDLRGADYSRRRGLSYRASVRNRGDFRLARASCPSRALDDLIQASGQPPAATSPRRASRSPSLYADISRAETWPGLSAEWKMRFRRNVDGVGLIDGTPLRRPFRARPAGAALVPGAGRAEGRGAGHRQRRLPASAEARQSRPRRARHRSAAERTRLRHRHHVRPRSRAGSPATSTLSSKTPRAPTSRFSTMPVTASKPAARTSSFRSMPICRRSMRHATGWCRSSAFVERLRATVPVAIVMLDACRDNPFPPGALIRLDPGAEAAPIAAAGLGREPRRGALFRRPRPARQASAPCLPFPPNPVAPRSTARLGTNSPYAAAVLRHFGATNGEEFGTVMRMVAEEVYLKTVRQAAAVDQRKSAGVCSISARRLKSWPARKARSSPSAGSFC